MKKTILLLLVLTLVFSCKDSKKTNYVSVEKPENGQEHPGKKLMEINCYVCHSPTASQEDRIGPPMIGIKRHYITDNTTKSEFIEAMQAWIKNPNNKDAKMRGAVLRFGVMPKAPYPEETIRQIADYMFDYEIEQPDWFEDHFHDEHGNHNGQRGQGKRQRKRQGKGVHKNEVQANFEHLPYGERGLKYALTTKAVLGKNLMGTIQKKGITEALSFCHEQAYPLTDSMATVHNATIKRVSDKPRNPNNQANTEELEHIKTFKNSIANKQEPSPIVKEQANKVQVFYPITTNNMCLKCHGKPNETMESSIVSKIKVLYPKDKAIHYGVNEVRGIWSITFDK